MTSRHGSHAMRRVNMDPIGGFRGEVSGTDGYDDHGLPRGSAEMDAERLRVAKALSYRVMREQLRG